MKHQRVVIKQHLALDTKWPQSDLLVEKKCTSWSGSQDSSQFTTWLYAYSFRKFLRTKQAHINSKQTKKQHIKMLEKSLIGNTYADHFLNQPIWKTCHTLWSAESDSLVIVADIDWWTLVISVDFVITCVTRTRAVEDAL